MRTIPFSQLADLTAWLPLIDRQISNDDYGLVSTVYELYRQAGGGILLVTYRQDFSGVAQWGEFGSAEAALSQLPVWAAELMSWNARGELGDDF